ncbi:LegC family aminotransferase [Paraclostridium bifermentans]|uniref:LegC family aminotransferase n=1 Tax=Paraclostridium bifermentans TaxID=1490 RepID=UPI0022E099C6|nr:LegC family aminotransferase [Paraclostridium bifermentans]
MSKFIPLSVPNLKGKELDYVVDAVESEWVSTGGSYINKFEENISKYLKVDKAVACQSGTAALHLALKLCGVNHEDEVIVPTLTFIAAVNPVRYIGAEPIFMDCDDTLNMDLDKLEKFCKNECYLTERGLINKKTNKIVKAVVIVHIFGNLADLEKAKEICSKYNLKLVEDATEALGSYFTEGKLKGKFAGTIGDFGAYSFNGNKIITTGGGGMLVSKHELLIDKAKYLSTQAKDDELYYTHNEVGYNYRMTNVQAAIGVGQLDQLEEFISNKAKNYKLYKNEIENIEGLRILEFNKGTRPNYWFYSLVIDSKKFGMDRDELLKKLNENKIQTRPIWGLIHEQKPYLNNQSYELQKSDMYRDSILNIPCSTNLSEEDILHVVKVLKMVSKNKQGD